MSTLPYELWADLLGKPWREDARGPNAFDCVGLLLEITRRRGKPIPAYTSEVGALALALSDWELVADPQPGDAILIRSANPRWHVGVVESNGYMLHAERTVGSVVKERYNSFPWNSRIEGFYRWKQALSPHSIHRPPFPL